MQESPLTEGIDCCLNPELEDCAPIKFDENDPDFKHLSCINFKRSARAQAILGNLYRYFIRVMT